MSDEYEDDFQLSSSNAGSQGLNKELYAQSTD